MAGRQNYAFMPHLCSTLPRFMHDRLATSKFYVCGVKITTLSFFHARDSSPSTSIFILFASDIAIFRSHHDRRCG